MAGGAAGRAKRLASNGDGFHAKHMAVRAKAALGEYASESEVILKLRDAWLG